MESMRSERWNESIWKKDLIKMGGPQACVWSEEALGGDGVLGEICPGELLGRPYQSTACPFCLLPTYHHT